MRISRAHVLPTKLVPLCLFAAVAGASSVGCSSDPPTLQAADSGDANPDGGSSNRDGGASIDAPGDGATPSAYLWEEIALASPESSPLTSVHSGNDSFLILNSGVYYRAPIENNEPVAGALTGLPGSEHARRGHFFPAASALFVSELFSDTAVALPLDMGQLSSTPFLSVHDNQRGTYFGQSAAYADLNNDAVADLLVASPGEPEESCSFNSGVHIFAGPMPRGDLSIEDARTTILPTSGDSTDCLGHSLAIGDVTGDNIADLILGSSKLFVLPGPIPAGKIQIEESGAIDLGRSGHEQLELVDADGDGDLDITVSGFDTTRIYAAPIARGAAPKWTMPSCKALAFVDVDHVAPIDAVCLVSKADAQNKRTYSLSVRAIDSENSFADVSIRTDGYFDGLWLWGKFSNHAIADVAISFERGTRLFRLLPR